MKKYHSIGELLVDYRIEYNLSQIDLSTLFEVDTRTIQRWEKNETLVRPEKEKLIANETLIPFQLIRNLNAIDPIPTYYDFRIRKYALTKRNNNLPEAGWLKPHLDEFSKKIRVINLATDQNILYKDLSIQKNKPNPLSLSVLQKAVKLLPELNLIIMDDFGNYSGHCIVLPITQDTYHKLLHKIMSDFELKSNDLVDPDTVKVPIYLNFDITADCNDNVFYLAHNYLHFFQDKKAEDYIFCSSTMRYDSYALNEQLGLDLVWEKPIEHDQLGAAYHPRFYTGNFEDYFKDMIQ